MEILEAYDLTGSFRDAAELAGCSHHTVAAHVAARDAGGPTGEAVVRPQLIDEYLAKVEEWVEQSAGKIRADKAHDKLLALGYQGSERTTRRAVAVVKNDHRAGRRRVHRPWVTEPGMWLQYDFGDGPVIDGVKTTLFCAWLAWSRFRVVLAIRDKTMPSVFAALDVTLRRLGGAPTYVLTDNEKTVTVEHVAGIAVRNPQMVAFARHYAVTVHTCEPADPATKGGSESTVKLAKADLVPRDTNLLPDYASFAELEAACEVFCERGQHAGSPGHPPGTGRDAGRGTGPAAPGSRPSTHGRVRADPHGAGVDADGLLRRRAVLGAAHPARGNGVGPGPRPRRGRAGRDRPHRPTPGRSRWPGTGALTRAARRSPRSTSRQPQQGHWTDARRRRTPRTRSSSPWARAPTCG